MKLLLFALAVLLMSCSPFGLNPMDKNQLMSSHSRSPLSRCHYL
jgi:hypothetical protein